MKEGLLAECVRSLTGAGFVSFYCSGTRACFDVVARRGSELYIIKVLENIDGLSPEQGAELGKIAYMFGARSLVVGGHTKTEELGGKVLYERHGIPCFGLDAFKNMIGSGELPDTRKLNVLSVNVDGSVLAREREKHGLSLEQLAEKAGISKDTIYRYEHEKTGASPENIEKIEKVLNASVRREIDPFGKPGAEVIDEKTELSFVGFKSVRTRSAPFEVIGRKNASVFAGETPDRRAMKKRAGIYKNIDEVLHSNSCFLVNASQKDSVEGVPIVRKKELKEIKRPKELLKLLEERSE